MRCSLREEKKLWQRDRFMVAGIDEAGRGPIAGPVTAAAVIFQPGKLKIKREELKINPLREVRDSKQLTAVKREKLYKILTANPAIQWGLGIVSEKIIDKINIKNSAELAMEKALKNLEKKTKVKTDFLIIDGNQLKNPWLKVKKHKLIIKADEKVFSCAAASIIAKVTRDRLMLKLHKKYPQYGFDAHKGYPTLTHRIALIKYGPCEAHRKTFGPVFRDILAKKDFFC